MTTHPAAGKSDSYRPVIATTIYLLFGPLAWAAHFTLIYAGQSIVCAVASTPPSPVLGGLDSVQLGIIAATALGLAGVTFAPFLLRQPGAGSSTDELSRFLASSMRLLGLLSALGIAAAGAMAIILPTCPTLR